MKKTFIAMLALLCTITVKAADFKVGEAKYFIKPDGTVMLKDYTKATGDIVIPEKVKDQKKGTEYTVSAIGDKAFKKSAVTSVTIPSSVTSLGESAFEECGLLSSVKTNPKQLYEVPYHCFKNCSSLKEFDFTGVGKIGGGAFSGTGFTQIVIPEYLTIIGSLAFADCKKLESVYIQDTDTPLNINRNAFCGSNVAYMYIGRTFTDQSQGLAYGWSNNPNLKALYIGPKSNGLIPGILGDCPNASLIFVDENSSEQAVNIFSLMIPGYYDWAQNYGDRLKGYRMTTDQIPYNFAESRVKISGVGETYRKEQIPAHKIDTHPIYIGVTTVGNEIKPKQEKPYDIYEATTILGENWRKEIFLGKVEEFVRVAMEEPKLLHLQRNAMNPRDAMKYSSYVTNAIRVLCDSVYLVKPELNRDEIYAMEGFINNLLMGISADYGIENGNLKAWAKGDVLNKDLASGDHKEDYERLLKIIDRFLKYKNVKSEPYTQTVQLAALCGVGRWQEAAAYFPKVHRAVTDNGTYMQIPEELNYIQKAINAHGYKAIAPTYAKASAGKKKVSSAGGDGNNSLINFFVQSAIEAGIAHYKQKRAEKKARQLFYESLGLDKKGRPRK